MSTTKKYLGLALATLIATIVSLVAATSPASADEACRTPPYVSGSWNVQVCVSNTGYLCPVNSDPCYEKVSGYAEITSRPSNCDKIRVYLVDQNNVQKFSTSSRPCGDRNPKAVEVWDGEFGSGQVKARFVAFNSSGAKILSIDSAYIRALD